MVGAVSPAGGDMSEPMTQNSLRVTGAFWALDTSLAHRRHFPAISWTKSYTLFLGQVKGWYESNVAPDWLEHRDRAMSILQKETELQEIVQLVGPDACRSPRSSSSRSPACSARTSCSSSRSTRSTRTARPTKQYWMLKTILTFNDAATGALNRGVVAARDPRPAGPGRDRDAQDDAARRRRSRRCARCRGKIGEDIAGIEVY